MKRRLSIITAMLFMLCAFMTPAFATNNANSPNHTIFYEDGSYAIISCSSDIFTRSSTSNYKTWTYYSPLGQRCFAYTLYGDFTYNGVTSYANSCDYQAIIYRQGWDIDTHSEYVSGNTAYGNATFTGPDGQIRPASLTLTCDKDGNVT